MTFVPWDRKAEITGLFMAAISVVIVDHWVVVREAWSCQRRHEGVAGGGTIAGLGVFPFATQAR